MRSPWSVVRKLNAPRPIPSQSLGKRTYRVNRRVNALALGDLHIENFGTWRDTEGRLVWGVNDVDEVCRLAYMQDLVRLATSTLFAIREHYLAVSDRAACDAILQGYARGLAEGGRAVVLAEHHRSLREFAHAALRDPVKFWRKLQAGSRTR